MRVKIEKLDHFGRGICYVDGKICFVEDTLPGEVVNVKVILDKKKFYLGKVKDFYAARISIHDGTTGTVLCSSTFLICGTEN